MSEMTSTENSQTEASRHAAAIERWENEGGASNILKHDRRKTIKKTARFLNPPDSRTVRGHS
jgi:hypothetical protein